MIDRSGSALRAAAATDACPVPVRSRRAILTAGLAALGLSVADAVVRPTSVGAGSTTPVWLGTDNSESSTTVLTNTQPGQGGVWGRTVAASDEHAGVGLRGDTNGTSTNTNQPAAGVWGNVGGTNPSSKAVGVLGRTSAPSMDSAGVLGLATGSSSTATGVRGIATSGPGVHGTSVSAVGVSGYAGDGTEPSFSFDRPVGVFGFADRADQNDSYGVYGRTKNGTGVFGASTNGTGVGGFSPILGGRFHCSTSTGTGVWVDGGAIALLAQSYSGDAIQAEAANGRALRTSGRLAFEKISGVATIAAGATSVSVTPDVNVVPGSFVLLTPRANLGSRGLWYTLDAANDRFTIKISSPYSNTQALFIAWLLIG